MACDMRAEGPGTDADAGLRRPVADDLGAEVGHAAQHVEWRSLTVAPSWPVMAVSVPACAGRVPQQIRRAPAEVLRRTRAVDLRALARTKEHGGRLELST